MVDIRELDIVRLTAELQLKHFILTLEDSGDILSREEAVKSGSKVVFEFYKRVRLMNDRYAKIVPGLTSRSSGAGFNVEGWFSPFMYKWLQYLTTKTIDWVDNAVKNDNFQPGDGYDEDGETTHSSSITDLFSVIYSELEFITDLEWSNSVQNAQFFQMFAKVNWIHLDRQCRSRTLLRSYFCTQNSKSYLC